MGILDFNAIATFMQNLDLATGSSLASLFAFFKQIHEWRENQRRQGQADTVAEYLEWLRRQNHQQLVDLITQNEISFQQLFAGMESSIVTAIQQLDANMERRHVDLASLDVSPAQLKIKYDGFRSAANFQKTPTWMNEILDGWLTIVNQSRSNLTLTAGSLTIRHGNDTYQTVLHTTDTITPNSGSLNVRFRTERAVRWRQGEVYMPETLTLSFAQTDGPFKFEWQGDRFVPTTS